MPNTANRIGLFPLLVLLLSNPSLNGVAGQEPINSEPKFDVKIGFDGHVKLGSWSPVYFQFPQSWQPETFSATALDGNGLPVRYSGKLLATDSGNAQGWINVGRSIGMVTLAIQDGAGSQLAEKEIDLQQSAKPKLIESTVPMILCIESNPTIAENIKSVQSQLFGSECHISSLKSAARLPMQELALQGIRVIYLSMSDISLVNRISELQWKSIQSWVLDGGKLVISLGPNSAQAVKENTVLSNLIPGKIDGTFEINNSIQFERYARSKPPQLLKRGDAPILATRIVDPQGDVELAIGNKPLVVRKPYGFGQIVCSTVDFDLEPLTQWNGHKKFLMRLTFGQLNLNRTTAGATESRNIVTYGYRDILGQLVFPLEKFSRVSFINFTVVAVLIALFLLCIGPGDFFLLRHTIGKMEWTWLTFSLFAAAFCFLAVYISRTTKPDQIQVNQLEIIDIDESTNFVRGNVWTNIYSPENSKSNLSAPATNELGIDTSAAKVCWMGIPGSGLGGMSSRSAAGLLLQNYNCPFDNQTGGCRLEELPIKVSSTKSLFTQYWAQHDFKIRNRLSARRNKLQGTIKNPFDFQLEDCRVVYDNWTYVLKLPLGPGDTVDIGSEFIEKTSSSYFSRRAETEPYKGGTQPWTPEEDNMDRIAEMMMFFELGGGEQYTRLTHDYRPQIDLSELLSLDRAMLFGKINRPATNLKLESDAGDSAYDQSRTYIRIVLPVETKP